MEHKETIPEKLIRENKIRIVGEYTASQKHHEMECLVCGNEWSATPKSKTQTFKKYGVSGCPECNEVRKNKRWESERKNSLDSRLANLEARGLEIITPNYDGRYKSGGNKVWITVRNLSCGHEFKITAHNLFHRDVNCGECNKIRKKKSFQGFNRRRQDIYRETADEWGIYRHAVYRLTRITYGKYKNEINPMGLRRGKCGVEGAYQLDHIRAVRFCFENDISAEECASKDNLQMLTWEDNLAFKNKVKS